ncbi:uncharacterized protein LOC108864378 [Galendromus occidentalis]|uniref:Uncharacterized protein LOC108864378 n=1 Tax=Galendromus occidentalis TaxID=34638 RepID=A0AAJ7L4H3_9ACAR|nr:uncharacterized protein LOC108864378 [Galendromus occidentalis]
MATPAAENATSGTSSGNESDVSSDVPGPAGLHDVVSSERSYLDYDTGEDDVSYGSNDDAEVKDGAIGEDKDEASGEDLSPTLFMLYISRLERRLVESGRGVKIRTSKNIFENKESRVRVIPGMLYADDLLLLAHSWSEMKQLLQITTEVGNELRLVFNPKKSAVLDFNEPGSGVNPELSIQGLVIPTAKSYKYLGITLCNNRNYRSEQEKEWKEKSTKAVRQMYAKSLWKFNRFEVTKIQWKATCVPALTYCNSVLTASADSRKRLETSQREAGKWALGQPTFNIANEFIEGELGWASYQSRGAKSEIHFFARLERMPSHRWPKAILEAMKTCNIFSEAYKRMKHLSRLYECEFDEAQHVESEERHWRAFRNDVSECIRTFTDREWRENMETKPSLKRYRQHKMNRGTIDHVYDNTK